MATVGQCYSLAYVLAYKEDVTRLVTALEIEGFSVDTIRAVYTKEEEQFSQSIRVLFNHMKAWQQVVVTNQAALIVESDFVPCKGIFKFRTPIPDRLTSSAIGWLYTCGPEFYELVDSEFLRCHSAAPVALVVSPQAAERLLQFAKQLLSDCNPGQYSTWDTEIRYYLQNYGFPSFMPLRNYGEHGGLPNKEHGEAGLHPTHRADVLAGPLHYLPQYANNDLLTFLKTRLKYKIRGVGRLFAGRFIAFRDIRGQASFSASLSMVGIAVRRLLYFR